MGLKKDVSIKMEGLIGKSKRDLSESNRNLIGFEQL